MLQFCEVLSNGQYWAKKLGFFCSFWEIFCLQPCTPYEMNTKIFPNWKTLLRCICGNFHQYSICGCEIKNAQIFFVLIQPP